MSEIDPPPVPQDCFIYTRGMKYEDIPHGVECVLVEEGVERIEELAFHNLYGKFDNLRRVILAKSVMSIGGMAFDSCKNLVIVEIPNDSRLLVIQGCAFLHCKSLASVSFPPSLAVIGYAAFGKCSSLVKIVIGGTYLQVIEGFAFLSCSNLTTIEFQSMPASLSRLSIHRDAFAGCQALSNILLPKNAVLSKESLPNLLNSTIFRDNGMTKEQQLSGIFSFLRQRMDMLVVDCSNCEPKAWDQLKQTEEFHQRGLKRKAEELEEKNKEIASLKQQHRLQLKEKDEVLDEKNMEIALLKEQLQLLKAATRQGD